MISKSPENIFSFYLAGLLSVLIWGLAPALTKLGVQEVSYLSFALFRYGISVLILSTYYYRKVMNIRFNNNLKQWSAYLFLTSLFLISQIYVLKKLPVSLFVIGMSLCPLIVLTMMHKISLKGVLLLLLAIVGMGMFVEYDELLSLKSSHVDLLILLASILSWSFTMIVIKKIQRHNTDFEIMYVGNVCVFVVTSIYFVVSGGEVDIPSYNSFYYIFLLAILMPLSMFLFNYTLRKVPIFAVTVQYLEVVFGLLFAVLLFSEKYGRENLIGTLLIFISIYFVNKMSVSNTKVTDSV